MQPGSLEEIHPPTTHTPLHTLTHPYTPVHTLIHPYRRVQLLSLGVAKANATEWVDKLAAWEGATHLVPV